MSVINWGIMELLRPSHCHWQATSCHIRATSGAPEKYCMKLTVKCPRREKRGLESLPTPTAEPFLGTDHGPSSAHPRLLQGAPESGRITPEIWGTGNSISLAREISNRPCFCGQIKMRDEGKKTWGKPVVCWLSVPGPGCRSGHGAECGNLSSELSKRRQEKLESMYLPGEEEVHFSRL